MKTKIATLIALTVGLSALHAQSDTAPASGRQTGSTQRAKPATPLVVATLDANHRGIIGAAEMNNAGAALTGLDKNRAEAIPTRGLPAQVELSAPTPNQMKRQPPAASHAGPPACQAASSTGGSHAGCQPRRNHRCRRNEQRRRGLDGTGQESSGGHPDPASPI